MLCKESQNIIDRLCAANFEAYVVGGFVRDLIAGVPSNDVDVATNATTEQLQQVFQEHKIVCAGTKFLVHMIDGVEVATYRQDEYAADRTCTVTQALHLEDDLSRRDFTVNAMAMCPYTGDVIDLHNGAADIKQRLIKFVGDPVKRINEHPIRILRACRFVPKVDGDFDGPTFRALRDNVHLVDTLAPETIGIEVMKAMKIQHASTFFAALHNIGALGKIFPGLEAAVQHTGGSWHPEDVFTHQMLAGDAVSVQYPIVKLAAYLHDYGKPTAFSNSDEGRFICHETVGEDLLRGDLRRLCFSNDIINTVCGLVRSHMRSFEPGKGKSVRKFVRKLADSNVEFLDWLRIRIVDHASNVKNNPYTVREIKDKYINPVLNADVKDMPLKATDLALKGGELISLFSLAQGPIVGQLQRHLLDHVVNTGINTKEELQQQAAAYLAAL